MLKELIKQKTTFEPAFQNIKKMEVTVLGSELTHDEFFDKWDVAYQIRVHNGSSVPLSAIKLYGTMGINGKPEVLYEFTPTAEFSNGLRVGEETTLSGKMVGFLSFDRPITLDVREAKSREFRFQVLDAADFSAHWLLNGLRLRKFNRSKLICPEQRKAYSHFDRWICCGLS
jgi:hypothetical protein